jgi:hypothetical protein
MREVLEPITPANVASCPVCACLVLVWPMPGWGDVPLVWDPGHLDRRRVRQLLGPDWTSQGFGLAPSWGAPHECPPPEDCRLPDREDRVAAELRAQEWASEAARAIAGSLRTKAAVPDGCGDEEEPERALKAGEVRP